MRSTITATALWILAVCGATAAQESPRVAALKILAEELAKPGSAFTSDMLSRAAVETGLAQEALYTALLGLLDALAAERQDKSVTWQELIALGGADVDSRKVDRMLRECIAWGRKVSGGKANYSLDLIVERTAEKARMPTHRALELLTRLINHGLTGTAGDAVSLPEKLGILVVGQSEYRVDPSRFPAMLISEEDISEQTRFRDLHVRLVSGLAVALTEAEQVRWAIDGSHPRLAPDAVLQLTISDFYSQRVRRDVYLHTTVRIALRSTAGVQLYSTELEMAYDYWLEPDDRVRSQRRLDGFLRKLTSAVGDEVLRYLKERNPD